MTSPDVYVRSHTYNNGYDVAPADRTWHGGDGRDQDGPAHGHESWAFATLATATRGAERAMNWIGC